jgi:ATP-binding cassette subfamily F protein 3
MLIQINDISLHYGSRTILDKANCTFSTNQKIGVIGRNGAGKSTLCKIIVGEEEPEEGSVQFSRDLRLSYLQQKDPFEPGELVVDFLQRISGQPDWECGKIAAKFGLGYEMLYVPIESLSGGYQMRVKLTSMLLNEPNFLILDEPTNYLDLSTLLFLERFLNEYNGSFLVVSHDREFLKRTCDHTVEVENGKVFLYKGDVEDYLGYKENQLEQKEQHNKAVERQRKHLQSFVDRFGSKASKASSAQSKLKQIAKLKTIEIEHALSNVKIKMPELPVRKGVALETKGLAVGYPNKRVAGKINFHIDKGKHVAILGNNGQGKSTFLKTVAGEIDALEGDFKWGHEVKLGYYAQHVFHFLNENDSVVDFLDRKAGRETPRQVVLDLAGSFLFSGNDVNKKIKLLSGGERARLVLAGLLLSKCDILLLDEPTNHLDFETVEALGTALKNYKGTVFFISHDRTFVNMLATQILEVKEGKIQLYPGTYEEYVYHLELQMDEE